MNRRQFLHTTAAAICAAPVHAIEKYPSSGIPMPPKIPVPDLDIASIFEASSPEVLAFAKRVMEKCALEKLRKPTPPLARTWVAAGGPHYVGQWIWDTMFVVDLISILPDRIGQMRDIFGNYWDFQDRWNAKMPEHARDMITVAIKTAPQEERRFSQIPILAWGLERVYQRNGDKEILQQALPRLERFHDWYWRERDVHDNGLITVGAYTGDVQHARWETFDYEVNMDDLKLTKHPHRHGSAEGPWYGDICVPGNNAYLIMAERSLARLARQMGDEAMAVRREKRIGKGVDAMREHLWDEASGTFLSCKRDSLEKIPARTIGGWIPLAAGVPTHAQADRMAEVLSTPAFQTPLPVPTVGRDDARFDPRGFWRGDVWPPTNYQIASGLAAYGHKELAADIADKSIANAMKHGISEHYNSLTGEALGVADYSMSSVFVTMMLDGLSRKHTLTPLVGVLR
jgi:putative isomerase